MTDGAGAVARVDATAVSAAPAVGICIGSLETLEAVGEAGKDDAGIDAWSAEACSAGASAALFERAPPIPLVAGADADR